MIEITNTLRKVEITSEFAETKQIEFNTDSSESKIMTEVKLRDVVLKTKDANGNPFEFTDKSVIKLVLLTEEDAQALVETNTKDSGLVN